MDYLRTTLPNGMRLVLAPMPGVQSASVAVFVGLGSRFEPRHQSGVSHLIEHMLFKGTDQRPRAQDISETIDAVGGILNASTDKELTIYWAKVAVEHLPLAVDLLADMLRNSRFRPGDLAREKRVVLEELAMLADDPQDWVHVIIDEVLWPDQPLGREVAGTRDSVTQLRRSEVLSFLHRYYGPNNVVIAVAGGIAPEDTSRLIERAFDGWGRAAPVPAPAATVGAVSERARVDRKTFEQANICLAYPAVARDHPDRWPLDVLSTILGGGTSSRLFLQLRERMALAYDVHSYTNYYNDTGALVLYVGTEASKLPKTLQAMFREVDRFQRRRVLDRELSKAKQYFRGRLWLGLEDTQAVAAWFGAQEILQHEVISPETAADLVDAVSAEDILRVSRTYLRPDVARLAAVGPLFDLDLETHLLGA